MAAELDYSRITQTMGDVLAADDAWRWDLEHGELSWALEGWDGAGFGTVTVLHRRSGQVVAVAEVHRTALEVES